MWQADVNKLYLTTRDVPHSSPPLCSDIDRMLYRWDIGYLPADWKAAWGGL